MKKALPIFLSLLFILFWLSGCATSPEGGGRDAGPYPSNYKELIIGDLRPRLYDPYSLMIERLDAPTLNTIQRGGCLSR